MECRHWQSQANRACHKAGQLQIFVSFVNNSQKCSRILEFDTCGSKALSIKFGLLEGQSGTRLRHVMYI